MVSYTNWDANKRQACVCDPYYTGTDCSLKQCPRGDNVLTLTAAGQPTQTFGFTTSDAGGLKSTSQFTITYMDLYGGVWTTRPITIGGGVTVGGDATGNTAIKAALQALPNAVIPAVTVTSSYAGTTMTYVVTFTDEANAGPQNPLTINWKGCTRAGCTPYYTGLVSTTAATAVTVTIPTTGTASFYNTGVSTVTAVSENAICSEHGICDTTSGQCKCFSGFYDLGKFLKIYFLFNISFNFIHKSFIRLPRTNHLIVS